MDPARPVTVSKRRYDSAASAKSAFDVYDVSFAGFGGHPIKGWYITPAGGRAERCVVKFIGYGGGRDLPHQHLLWPSTGRAVLVMDTRGQGSSWSMADT